MQNLPRSTAASNTGVDEDALADRILAKLVARIAGASKPATYSDRKGCGPAGLSDEKAKELIRLCPHSVKRGRWCVVDREAFETWERAGLPAVAPAPAPAAWSPAAALARAGLRRTR